MNDLLSLATLIKQRNAIEQDITAIIGRPAQIGHVGEYIASRIFNIKLEESASAKSIDGYFLDSPLKGRSVNIKWYGKLENLLDITPTALPDFYLVMTGPKATSMTSKGMVRPWIIDSVYLFDACELVDQLKRRGVKISVATSVRKQYWEEAEIYPIQRNTIIILSQNQRLSLAYFGS